MYLIRKLKITRITNKPLEGIDKEIFDFINSKLNDLIEFIDEERPNEINYMNSEGKFILQQDNNKDLLYVRYKDFWEVLENKYLIKYDDIQILIKYIVQQVFKQKVSTPKSIKCSNGNRVEQAFKQKVSMPTTLRNSFEDVMEQTFKRKVSTPFRLKSLSEVPIELAFKQKIKK